MCLWHKTFPRLFYLRLVVESLMVAVVVVAALVVMMVINNVPQFPFSSTLLL